MVSFEQIRSAALPALTALALLGVGCDSGDTEDAVGSVNRIQLSLESEDGGHTAQASVRSDGDLSAGSIVVADTLVLRLGTLYGGGLRLFGRDNRDVTPAIEQEAESFQIFYSVENAAGVGITVSDVESDYGTNSFGEDLPVGLGFALGVTEDASLSGQVRVRVGEFPPGRKNGQTLTVDPIVDTVLPFRVEAAAGTPGPGDPESITQAVLAMESADGLLTWTVTAASASGLDLGPDRVPGDLEIVRCEHAVGAVACRDESALTLQGGVYDGHWTLLDDDGGLNEQIEQEGEWHQLFQSVNFSDAFSDFDLDRLGLPLGLRFTLTVPVGVIIANGRLTVALAHFDPAIGEIKTGQNESSQYDMQFRVPLIVQQNGPPEQVTRSKLTLARTDGLEELTITVAGTDLQLNGDEPDSVVVVKCVGAAPDRACSEGTAVELTRSSTYNGSLEVFNDQTGDDVMAEILAEDVWHQVFYETDASIDVDVTDTDAEGLPLGFATRVTTPDVSVGFSLRITLDHYGRSGFKILGRSDESDMDYSFSVAIP